MGMIDHEQQAKANIRDKDFSHAVNVLEKNYQKALNNPQIHTPIAWALYHTWREIDTEEKRRRGKKGMTKCA